MTKLERIVNQLNLHQRTGIFQVPEAVENYRGTKIWLKKFRKNHQERPVVIEEEEYTRSGVAVKLKTCQQSIVNEFSHFGLIRPQNSEDFSYKFKHTPEKVSPISIAQVFSWALQSKMQNILVSEQSLKNRSHTIKTPAERVKELYNVYEGVGWFERFKKKQAQIAKTTDAPEIREWRRITRGSLADFFILDAHSERYTLKKLCYAGLVIPVNGRPFQNHSAANLIEPEGFAQLVALLYGKDIKDVLVRREKDEDFAQLSSSFLDRKLIPYLKSSGIDPLSDYQLNEASKIIGVSPGTIRAAIRNGTLNHTEMKEKGKTEIRGIDLAIYCLKDSTKQVFGKEDVCNLLGIEPHQFSVLGFHNSTERNTFSRIHYVLPVYNEVAETARSKLLGEIRWGEYRYAD